nr:DUF6475 domain-containing protein [uncultured Desulfobacter sp.]
MENKEREIKFSELLSGVSEMYGQSPSPAVFEIWFNTLKRFDFESISRAFSVHIQDPDHGKFMPRPSDIVRIIEGSGQDSAFQAWTKFEKALGMIGTYETVIFDDPIIHRVVQDIGGWTRQGQVTEKEKPYVKNEFIRRYQEIKSRGVIPEYPQKLTGISEGHNRLSGFLDMIPEPVLIGNQTKAKAVFLGGTSNPSLQISFNIDPGINGQIKCLPQKIEELNYGGEQ